MKIKNMKNLIIAFAFVFSISGAYADDAETSVFDGYKGIAWGVSVQDFYEAYFGTVMPDDEENPSTETDEGIFSFQDDFPSRLIKNRTFFFNNGKFFKVVISFTDEALSEIEAIKSNFFADFGTKRMTKETSVFNDDKIPTMKIQKYSEMYVWKNNKRSILLEKYKTHVDAKSKKEAKRFMREMPEYKLAIFAAQSQNVDIAALEELIFSMILKSNERSVLQAIFVNEDIESEASNEDVY